MNWLSTVSLMLPSVGLGLVLMGAVGLPLAYRRGREASEEEAKQFTFLREIRQHIRRDDTDLPVQLGTLPEHQRRVRPPMQYVEITDTAALEAVEQIPIGAEPASVARGDRSGLASPAAGSHEATAARTSGNAAPTMEEETPPHAGGAAGPSWPRSWRLLWPALLFAARFWWTPTGVAVDRAVVASWAFLGRYEPRFFHDEPAARHAAPDLDGEAERRRLALFEPTQELKTLEVEPVRELVGVR